MDDNSAATVIRGSTDEPIDIVFSGKVMLFTVITLTVVCFIISFLHIYSRCYPIRPAPTTTTSTAIPIPIPIPTTNFAPQGLDPIILKSLPTFTYSGYSPTSSTPLECVICLAKFEESETGRLLPQCNHRFHIECIDMWFHSHSNCPLCRSPVQAQFTESPIGERVDVLTVIVEVTAAELGVVDIGPEPERGGVFKQMVKPVRLLRGLLRI